MPVQPDSPEEQSMQTGDICTSTREVMALSFRSSFERCIQNFSFTVLTAGVSMLTSYWPLSKHKNTPAHFPNSTFSSSTTQFHAFTLADPATFSSFKRCQLCWRRFSMCMLVHWTGGRDIDGTCSWLSSSVHTFPPGVLVVLLHNQREGERLRLAAVLFLHMLGSWQASLTY